MPARDPWAFPKGIMQLDNWTRALKKSLHRPPLGVTQGGSSRKDPGCKPAATIGLFKPQEKKS